MGIAYKLMLVATVAGLTAFPVRAADQAPAPAATPAPAPGEMPLEYTWFNGDDDDKSASLVYGNRESAEDITLAMNCQRKSGTVSVFIAETDEKIKPGQKATVGLSVGTATVSAKGKITANEMAGTSSAETTVPADAPIFAAMKEPGSLAIAVNAWKTSVTLKGIGNKAEEFAAACKK